MSAYPEDPRVFSQAKILVSVALPLSVLGTLLVPIFIGEYVTGVSDDIFSIIVPSFIVAMGYLLLFHGLFRRFGVDRLTNRELTVGQCETGDFGFFVLGDEPSNLKVDYRPGDLGNLTWAVEDVQ